MQKTPFYEGSSLSTEKQVIVVDVGTRYTKVGFAGETGPRAITRTEIRCMQTGRIQRVFDAVTNEELYDLFAEFFHKLFFRHLLVSPKDRRLVIVESILCPTSIRETLAKVFFMHFEVASLLFVPSHVVALSTLGVNTALVLDMGTTESVLIPVFEGVAVLHAWQAQPLAAVAIERRISSMLLEDGGDGAPNSVEVVGRLNEQDIEDIKVRTCFVTTFDRARKVEEGKPLPGPKGVKYLVGRDNCTVNVNGCIREHAHQVLFEQDADRMSVSTMILDAILKCSIDMRKPLAENILLMGGTAMIPGMRARILEELKYLVTTPPYVNQLKVRTFKFHTAPAKENYVAWLGGAIYGATDIVSTRSLLKEVYLKEKRVPDWVNLIYNTVNDGAKRSV